MLRSLRAAALAVILTSVALGQPAHAIASPAIASPAVTATCTATITIVNQWPTGYTAELVVVPNAGNWTVVAVYPDPAPKLGPAWNMTMAQDKNIAVFRPVPWTGGGGGFIGAGTTTAPDTLTCLVV